MIDVADGTNVDVGFVAVEFIASGGESSAGEVEALRGGRGEEESPGGDLGERGEGGSRHGEGWCC